MPISEPLNVLAAHIGSGAVLLCWDEPTTGTVDHYEVHGAGSLGGTYYQYMNGVFYIPRGVVYNVPMGITAYFKVRGIGSDGTEGTFAQAKKATIVKPTVLMNVTAISGSYIPAGAKFAVTDDGGRLVAFSADENITIE